MSPERWSTFVRIHLGAMLACDFFVTSTARFRTLYVFVVLGVGTRRIVHWNVTEHPTAAWTGQQFRAHLPGDQPLRLLIHDRDSIYSAASGPPMDAADNGLGEAQDLWVLRCRLVQPGSTPRQPGSGHSERAARQTRAGKWPPNP